MNKTLAIVIVAIIVLGGGYLLVHHSSNTGYGTDMDMGGYTDISSSTPDMTGTTASSSATSTATGSVSSTVKTFTVEGGNFYFAPKTLTVNKGDTVTITFKNSGGIHDFKIDEFNVATARISGGQSQTVTFVADKAGSFEYYCSVGTHRQMGMVGTLTVK
jgi:nitrosocyanin